MQKYCFVLILSLLLIQNIRAESFFGKFAGQILNGYRKLNNSTTLRVYFVNEEDVYPYNDSLYDSAVYRNKYYKYEYKYDKLYNGSPFYLRYDISRSFNPLKPLSSSIYLSITDRRYDVKFSELPINFSWTLTYNISAAFRLMARYSRNKSVTKYLSDKTYDDDYLLPIDTTQELHLQNLKNSWGVLQFAKGSYNINAETILLELSRPSAQGTGKLVPTIELKYTWNEQIYIYIDDIFYDSYMQNGYQKAFLLRTRPNLTVTSALMLNLSTKFTASTRFNFTPNTDDARNSMFQNYRLSWDGTWRLGRQTAYIGYSRTVYNYSWDNPNRTQTFKKDEVESAMKVTELVTRNKSTRERTVDQLYFGINIR